MTSSRRINVAIIGFGLSGRVFHASLVSSLPTLYDLRMIWTVNNASEASKLYPNAQIVNDITPIVHPDSNIDLVIVTTPNTSHYSLAEQCIQSGKHVVVEKPFTITSNEAIKLIELAKEKNVVLSVYHNRRWDSDFLTVQSIIKDKLLGRLVEYEVHFDRYVPNVNLDAWRLSGDAGSGILYDLGSHLIDQAIQLFGQPETLYADIRTMNPDVKSIDYFDVQLGYPDLKVTLKSTKLSRELGPKFVLHGTLGSFVKYGEDLQESHLKLGYKPYSDSLATWGSEPKTSWGRLNTELSSSGLHFEGTVETLQGCYHKYYVNIYDAIVNGSELAVKPEEALTVIQLIEAAEQNPKKTLSCSSILAK
jgi:scyllo-inositol 2-dehydrogenase (NADP+)